MIRFHAAVKRCDRICRLLLTMVKKREARQHVVIWHIYNGAVYMEKHVYSALS